MAGVFKVVSCVFVGLVCVAAHGQMSLQEAMAAHRAVVSHVAGGASAPASTQDALQMMFAAADVVFAGEVTAVERGEGAVTVRFRVDDAVRGVSAGETYALREWIGLWADDAARYRVGERRLMLLHANSAAGFASPVGDGAVPLRGDGVTATADLRWIAAHVAVTDAARVESALALRASGVTSPVAVESAVAVDASAAVDGAVVMDLLHAWQRGGVQ